MVGTVCTRKSKLSTGPDRAAISIFHSETISSPVIYYNGIYVRFILINIGIEITAWGLLITFDGVHNETKGSTLSILNYGASPIAVWNH